MHSVGDKKLLQINKFNPNMVRDCAFLTNPKGAVFQLPVDSSQKNRVVGSSSVSSSVSSFSIESKSKPIVRNVSSKIAKSTNKSDTGFPINKTLETKAVVSIAKNHTKSVQASINIKSEKVFKQIKEFFISEDNVQTISLPIETRGHGVAAPAAPESSGTKLSMKPQSVSLKVKKPSHILLKSNKPMEAKKILPPAQRNVSVIIPKSLSRDLSIEDVNHSMVQSQPMNRSTTQGSMENIINIEPSGIDNSPHTEFSFSFTETLYADQHKQVRLLDKQISKLQLAASRYCSTARKLLQKQVRGASIGAASTGPTTTTTTIIATTSLGDLMGSDVLQLRESIEQVLQSVHTVISDLQSKKSRILLHGSAVQQLPQDKTGEVDESEIINWKQNNNSNHILSMDCKNISEENMQRIHHMLDEEDRIVALRRKVRSGLHNFAYRVQEGSFPAFADADTTQYLDEYVDSYERWDAQEKADTDTEPLIMF